jgi:hypothetical protein
VLKYVSPPFLPQLYPLTLFLPSPQFREEIYQAFAQIYPVLNEFRKP